jgi:AcrR family transcriptional regulator
MSDPSQFSRARSPEQKEERRRHLLDSARSLLLEIPDLNDLGINELARHAQMTKSNVYRYFESSEAVLLEVLVEEFAQWRAALNAGLTRGRKSGATIERVAKVFAETAAARPLMCRLVSIVPSILERNISLERTLEFKRTLLLVRRESALGFNMFMPSIPAAVFETFVHHAMPMLIGLWPLSHPAEIAARVVAAPEMAPLRYDFRRDFEQGLLILLRGLSRKPVATGHH